MNSGLISSQDSEESYSPSEKMYNLDTINDEEEIKLPSDTIPVTKTNVKEGRESKL
jgi:hypothetical protein